MHKIYSLLAAMLLLAGCRQAANEAAPVVNDAGVPANAAAASAEASAANGQAEATEEVVADRIPAAFHGAYDRDGAACESPGSEERLRISADALHFHESIGEVRSVSAQRDRTISVEADFQGEGESWRNILRLSLGAGGTLTVTQPDGSSLTRIRCP